MIFDGRPDGAINAISPAGFRQPNDNDRGAVPHSYGLLPGRGFRGMGSFPVALVEGGPRSGVLTGIEDLIADAGTDGRALASCRIPAAFRFGILFGTSARRSQALAEFVAPYHDNRLLRSLETCRVARA